MGVVGWQSSQEGRPICPPSHFPVLPPYPPYSGSPACRHKVLNLISLEFSETPLAKYVVRPEVVRKLDWIDSYWPKDRRRKLKEYPQVWGC
jgi:hypothetical protein